MDLNHYYLSAERRRRTRRWVALRIQRIRPYFTFSLFALILLTLSYGDQLKEAPLAPAVDLPPQDVLSPAQTPSKNPWDYFHPTWKKSDLLGVITIKQDTPDPFIETTIPTRNLVEDPDNKLEPEFKVPKSIKSRVKFWVEIYSKYSSKVRVVHDRNNPDLIYGYIDFRPLHRSFVSAVTANTRAEEVEKKVLKELKVRFSEAAGITKTTFLTKEEKSEIQELFSRAGAATPKNAQLLISNIRTQSGQSDNFLLALYRSKNLLPHIESVLKLQGLPVALGRIPFVESSFNASAQSKIGALGIWQFTRETAKEMIHEDKEHLWSDPIKQTRSAARLLKMYRSVLPDWGCVVTSYNSGVGRVRRLLEKSGAKGIEDLLQLPSGNDGLGFAGKNFYAEFLAANIVEAYKEEIFQHLLNPSQFALVFKDRSKALPKEECEL